MDVFPDFGGVGGAADLRAIVGALLMFVLVTAVLMLIVCAIIWAIASSSGNYQAATKARTGLFVAVGAAALAGAGVAWLTFRLDVGSQLCLPPPPLGSRGAPDGREPLLVNSQEHPVIDIDPNSSGLPGIEQLRIIVGAVMTVGLILSVLALIVSAIVWGFGANSSNPHLASRGKVGVLVSCGAAIICGAAVTLINFFWGVGQAV